MKLRKALIIIVLLLGYNMLFSQNSQALQAPWNIKTYYGKQYDKALDANYPCIGLKLNRFFAKWINAGVFVNGGTYKYGLTYYENNNSILYDSDCRDLFWKYGIDTEFHPNLLLFPNFRVVDVYFDAYFGASSYTSDYWSSKHQFLYGAGIGIVMNLSRHFGLFYERDYDNVNTKFQDNEEKIKAMNCFGLNIRF